MVIQKILKAPGIIWTHKKKSLFAAVVSFWGFSVFEDNVRSDKIRRQYAIEAKKYGETIVRPIEKNRKVVVLIDEEANGGKASRLFEKNALFLLNLAGLELNIIKVNKQDDLETISQVLDKKEADAIYAVGGDQTVSRIISGLYNNVEVLPLGIFPGGSRNKWAKLIFPSSLGGSDDDVKKYCESAMAIIKDSRIKVYPMRCELYPMPQVEDVTLKSKVYYILSDISLGWFEHCEQKKLKLWFLAGLKDYFVYFWEFVKRYPDPFHVSIEYFNFCSGCKNCRKVVKTPQKRSWVNFFIGKSSSENCEIDYTKIRNDGCSIKHEKSVQTSNIEIFPVQEKNRCKLVLNASPVYRNRFLAIFDNWKQTASKLNEDEVTARQILLRVSNLPEFIQKLSVAGHWTEFQHFANQRICLQSVDKSIQIFSLENISTC